MPSKISGNWIVFRYIYIYIFQELSYIYVLWCILFFTNHFSSKVPTHPQPWAQHAREKDMKFCQSTKCSLVWENCVHLLSFHLPQPEFVYHLLYTFHLPSLWLRLTFCDHMYFQMESSARHPTPLHKLNYVRWHVELPESFQLLSMLIFCNYENTSNFLHIPHPQATTNNDCELR